METSSPPVTSEQARQRLAKRMSYFFSSAFLGRDEVTRFLKDIQEVCPVAILGGMPRDLHLLGNREFHSDIDIVAHPGEVAELEAFLVAATANTVRRNRFGGYRMLVGQGRVDVWALQESWCVRSGVRRLESFQDLLSSTFFDWDAILYLPASRSILTGGSYFERVDGRLLGINMLENPHPFGNAVRALRTAARWQADLDGELVDYVTWHLRREGWEAACAYERSSLQSSHLQAKDRDRVFGELRRASQSAAPAQLFCREQAPGLL